MKTERKQLNTAVELLSHLHDDLAFEIFTNYEQNEKKSKKSVKLFPSTVSSLDLEILQEQNNPAVKRGIWFTPNSMKHGKRLKVFVSCFNAVVLENDFKGAKEEIDKQKQEYLAFLLDLQLKPTVIIESKNGYHIYWFLEKGTITDVEPYETLQCLMQQRLDTDNQALGAERLFRLPGFYHWKDEDDPFLCEIIHADYSRRYSFDELVHKYGGKKKFSSLKRKKAIGKYSGKPIILDDFKVKGNIEDIFTGCHVFSEIKNIKDPSHDERLGILWTLINLGNDGLEVLREIAQNWNDYDEEATESNIEYACKKGYRASTCDWFIKKGICSGRCVNIRHYRKPIDLYYHPVSELLKRSCGHSFYPAQNLSLTTDHSNITEDIMVTMKDRGQDVRPSHKNTLLTIVKVMSVPLYNDKPLVIPAPPGFGKTTLIIAYIKYMLEHKPGFGAVIVVERQETIKEITEKINYDEATGYDLQYAYPMLGYSSDDCKKKYTVYRPSQCKKCDVSFKDCRVKYNFVKQQNYPIVVISHSRLFQMSDKNNLLSSLRKWKTSDYVPTTPGKITFETNYHKREILLIDERPQLVENVPTDSTTLDTLLTDVQDYAKEYYPEVLSGVSLIRNYYALPNDYEQIDPIEEGFNWTSDFTETWYADYRGDYPEYPELVANIIREGGLYSKHDHTVTTTHYSNIYWQDYSTFVFDGTATLDPDYHDDKFYFLDVPQLRPYTNLTLNICMEKNLSKTFYLNNPGFIPQFVEDIKKIAKNDKTYVVCYKSYEDEYERLLNGVKNISIEHYGNTKGTNHLIDNVNIVCTGILNKGESYYLSKTIALKGNYTSYQSVTTDNVRRFQDEKAESVKVYEMVTELVQEIFRTQIRNHSSDLEVNVYLCSRDVNLISTLEDSFPGCSVSREWSPKALLNDREAFREFVEEHGDDYKTKTKLIKAFLDQGYSLNTDDIVGVIGISSKNAARYLK